jgi:hypothetical protein
MPKHNSTATFLLRAEEKIWEMAGCAESFNSLHSDYCHPPIRTDYLMWGTYTVALGIIETWPVPHAKEIAAKPVYKDGA